MGCGCCSSVGALGEEMSVCIPQCGVIGLCLSFTVKVQSDVVGFNGRRKRKLYQWIVPQIRYWGYKNELGRKIHENVSQPKKGIVFIWPINFLHFRDSHSIILAVNPKT